MNKGLHKIFLCLAVFSLVCLSAACGSNEADDSKANSISSKAVEKPSKDSEALPDKTSQNTPESSVPEALKTMAASEGLYFGEIPENFPVSFLPPFPDGEIQQASFEDDGEATLLQVVPVDKEEALKHYSKFYNGLGWDSDDPITVAGRTMVGFIGKDSQVDMTLIDRDGGKTFVALAYY